jgi:hypothetical protein
MADDPAVVSLGDVKVHCLLYLKSNQALIIGTDSQKLFKILPPYTKVSDSKKSDISQIESMTEATSGKFWASGSFTASNEILIILYSSSLETLQKLPGHNDTVIGLAFKSGVLYSASEDRSIKMWPESSSKGLNLYLHDSPVIAFDFKEKTEMIASCDSDNILKLFSLKDSHELWTFTLDEKIWSLKFLESKSFLVCGDHSGNLIGLDFEKRKKEFMVKVHDSRIRGICMQGRFIVTGSFDSRVGVWDSSKRTVVACFENHNDWIRTVSSSDDFIFSGGDDSAVVALQFNFKKVKVKNQESERKSWNSVYASLDDVKVRSQSYHEDLLDIHSTQNFEDRCERENGNFRNTKAASVVGGSLLLTGLIGILVFFGFS